MNLVWATRGRAWGFRFLLDGGFDDPLPIYDSAFSGTDGESTVYRRIASRVALRFPDPLGRRDAAGRVIPHDLVVLSPLADEVRSVEEGVLVVWPLIADVYADVWDTSQPPSGSDIRGALGPQVDPDTTRDSDPNTANDAASRDARAASHTLWHLTKPAILGLAVGTVGTAALVAWGIRRVIRSREHQKTFPRLNRGVQVQSATPRRSGLPPG